MMVLLAGGVRTNKEKQPKNFHLKFTTKFVSMEVYRRHTINNCALFFALDVFLSERRNFEDNKINFFGLTNSFYLIENIFIAFRSFWQF